jgi:hypothetical protein
MALYRAYGVRGAAIPTYFIESTAPDNVDDPSSPAAVPPLFPIDANTAIDEIARALSGSEQGNLVVMVHGFNNPQANVLKMYATASDTIEHDPKICTREGLVCVGYRWPSEKMGSPWRGTFTALPSLPTWILWLGLALAAVYPVLGLIYGYGLLPIVGHVVTMLGLTCVALIFSILLLRVVVYFRDGYRATNYGAPDLIEIIRQIDATIVSHDMQRRQMNLTEARKQRADNRVTLSFIGHSMGGYVVTNAIRVLSDLFSASAVPRKLNTGVVNEQNLRYYANNYAAPDVSPEIGHAFTAMHLVLASPDIPAEALLSNRANFLASSLRRFREAYLFSNQGDEVLRLISTMANYFSFPTKRWTFGYRLGNAEILSSGYGLVHVGRESIVTTIRVGFYTLRELYQTLFSARQEFHDFDTLQDKLPERFSYFDCTDYVEPDRTGSLQGLLTFALRAKRHDPKARLTWWQNFRLLFSYLIRQKPDVHGGYFEGELSQRLMYRLACLGFAGTVPNSDELAALDQKCREKQIRVLLSPGLRPGQRQAMPPPVQPTSPTRPDVSS